MIFGTGRRTQRIILVRYLLVLTAISLVWEFAQMPLYTLGKTGTAGEIIYAALHCTAGDAIIGGFSLLAALIAFGTESWPRAGRVRVLVGAMAFGLGYTVFSEWLNVELRGSWAYSELMPVVPFIGTGLAPPLQWVVIPLAVYFSVLSRSHKSLDESVRVLAANDGTRAGQSDRQGNRSSSDRATKGVMLPALDLSGGHETNFRRAAQRT